MMMDNDTFSKLLNEKNLQNNIISFKKINYLIGDINVNDIDFSSNLANHFIINSNMSDKMKIQKCVQYMDTYKNYPDECREMIARKKLNLNRSFKEIRNLYKKYKNDLEQEERENKIADLIEKREKKYQKLQMSKIYGNFILEF